MPGLARIPRMNMQHKKNAVRSCGENSVLSGSRYGYCPHRGPTAFGRREVNVRCGGGRAVWENTLDEGTVGLLVLGGISIASSMLFHLFVRRYLVATLIAALTSITLFLVFSSTESGYIDPFFPIAFVVGFS